MLNYDVLGLTELHNVQNKKIWKCKRWITSQDSIVDGQGHISDPTAGVGILLSQRFANMKLTQGFVGSRIVWVHIQGPVCPLFIVCVYVPHKYRTEPSATDILSQLDRLIVYFGRDSPGCFRNNTKGYMVLPIYYRKTTLSDQKN